MFLHEHIVLFLSVLGALFDRALGSMQTYVRKEFPHGVLDTYNPVWSNYTLFWTSRQHFWCASIALAAGHKMFKYENQVCSTSSMTWIPGYSGSRTFYYNYYGAAEEPGSGECYAPYTFVTGAGCIYFSNTPLMKHDAAQAFCKEIAGRLFVAANAAHYLDLRAHLMPLNVYALVGIQWVSGQFRWDDNRLVEAALWGAGEPNGVGPFAQVQTGSLDFYLNDIPDAAAGYVCQPTV